MRNDWGRLSKSEIIPYASSTYRERVESLEKKERQLLSVKLDQIKGNRAGIDNQIKGNRPCNLR